MENITIAIFVLMLSGCDFTGIRSEEVGSAIRKEVRGNNAKEIDLAEIVPFMWDELYLFGPYTPASNVCNVLGIPSVECATEVTQESLDDGEMYMVFKLAGDIVHKEMYIRFNGDFTPIDYPLPIKWEESKFVVVSSGEKAASGRAWLRLVPSAALTSNGRGRSKAAPLH